MLGPGILRRAVAIAALAGAAPLLPPWLISLATLSMATGLVVLGLIILWRAGLVSFGQGLFYAAGAYTVALGSRLLGMNDALALIGLAALAAGLLAMVVGLLLARYREIFFAMLSLALSMVLYGVLVKSEALGSTDGFGVTPATFFGLAPRGEAYTLAIFWLALAVVFAAALLVERYLASVAGALAAPIRDNEIRVEYLGISVGRLVHLKLVIAGCLAGMGGALAALTISHVDPNMAYWTTSGGFVFVTILAGAASVPAAFIGAFLFEVVRTIAVAVLPAGWQLILGMVLLLTILFVPEGLGSLARRAPAAEGEAE
jgi:ABC-type branched-subunit amino acid transport system permease subunit